MTLGTLGRLVPPDWDHLAAKPLSAAPPTIPKPVALGVSWYTSFDTPQQRRDGSWHVPDASRERLGKVRGGHCFCLAQMGGVKALELNPGWWTFYNQGPEGACEGFGHGKAQTLEKAVTVDPWFLYDEARRLAGTYPDGEGTTNRTLVKVLETKGAPTQVGPEVAERVDRKSVV